ncbi:unnamed protein product [Bursaphelenchus xylophilus]|uniref:(pine wood nematode) hypothetical protein n=1 Tax=Bursaphelenchus xylophilus TaxID=6326 RepID=A0A1I7SR34_BURXY|nr:unnamed protein product [Bursaphelenchus xylophilus]CAG9110772.1 unnamed protein product [Bursaphelenchus xylophilus]
MDLIDSLIFVFIMLAISVMGIYFSRRKQTRSSQDALIGSNVSVLSIALSVCSSFLSAVSLLGFPAEVYFRGSTPLWFNVVYIIAFPIVAYVFLPVFYHLRLSSIYEYLERRFSYASRILASSTFILQTIFYLAVALYAPSLALAQALNFPIFLSILITSSISAVYLLLGGARGGIYTSALQMALILISLFTICCAILFEFEPMEIYTRSKKALRLETTDTRFNPQVRHSIFAFLIGGSGNIFSLFAVNHLTLQRYMVMPTLRQAQKVVLLNIPMNALMAVMYTFMGLAMYAVYYDCHPKVGAPDQMLPFFVENHLNWLVGLEGVFVAAVYSAGISTLTASYNALTAVVLEDIVKTMWPKVKKEGQIINSEMHIRIIQILPFVFAAVATILAMAVKSLDTMVLQIAFSIFGAAGGAILAVFVIGLFCPKITNPYAALVAQVCTLLVSIWVAAGSLVYNVVPVNLPLSDHCRNSSSPLEFEWEERFGTVMANNDSGIWLEVSKISYQYYCVVAVVVCVVVGHIAQFTFYLVSDSAPVELNRNLLAFAPRVKPPNIIIEAPESQCLSKHCSINEEE